MPIGDPICPWCKNWSNNCGCLRPFNFVPRRYGDMIEYPYNKANEILDVVYKSPTSILSDESIMRIAEWAVDNKNVERPDWDQCFILDAWKASQRSMDPQTQHGCVLVKDKVAVSSGYNSFIRNIPDDILPNTRPNKYPWMIHAEHNAILNCARNGVSTLGTTAYVTGEPCLLCYQYMYQAGIVRVVYADINAANMTSTDKYYQTSIEIFLNLIRRDNVFDVDIVNIDESLLINLGYKIKRQKIEKEIDSYAPSVL